MPRHKKKNHRDFTESISREQSLKDRCSFLGWQVPFHQRNWQDYFISKASYMQEFERWLAKKCRMGGASVRVKIEIGDDLSSWGNQTPSEYEESWANYWGQSEWGEPIQSSLRQSGYASLSSKWARKLPMDHKIAAPSGNAGCNLVCI